LPWGLEDGCKLRVDTTVVETDIHHPTDNTLLWDAVQVVRRLATAIEQPIKGFRNRTRAARRRMQAIQRMGTQQRQTQQQRKYRELIGMPRRSWWGPERHYSKPTISARKTYISS
jgi:transposase, IS5 family